MVVTLAISRARDCSGSIPKRLPRKSGPPSALSRRTAGRCSASRWQWACLLQTGHAGTPTSFWLFKQSEIHKVEW